MSSSSDLALAPGANSSAPSQASGGASTMWRTVRMQASTQSRSARSARKLNRIGGGYVNAAPALGAQLMRDDGHASLLVELQAGRHQEGLHREHGVGAVEALAGLEEGTHRRGRVAQEALARGDVEEAL